MFTPAEDLLCLCHERTVCPLEDLSSARTYHGVLCVYKMWHHWTIYDVYNTSSSVKGDRYPWLTVYVQQKMYGFLEMGSPRSVQKMPRKRNAGIGNTLCTKLKYVILIIKTTPAKLLIQNRAATHSSTSWHTLRPVSTALQYQFSISASSTYHQEAHKPTNLPQVHPARWIPVLSWTAI